MSPLTLLGTNVPAVICVKLHQRDGWTVRPSVCVLCLDTVNESQRRRHGVTAAIAVDVVAVRVCPSVRLLDGV